MRKILLICFAWVSVFAQAQWTQINPSPTDNNLNSVFFPDTNTGYAVGDSGTIIKTIDGGTTWDTLSSGVSTPLASVFFPDANTGYAVGDSGTILKTINGGATWDTLLSGVSTPLASVFFTDVNTGYAVGGRFCLELDRHCESEQIVIKTTDGGITWEILIGSNSNHRFSSVYFIDSNIGYAVCGSASEDMIKTVDGGTTWDTLSIGTITNLNSVYFTNAETGYAAGYGGILKTTDGGTTWVSSSIETGYFLFLFSVFFTDASIGYAVGGISHFSGGVILKTMDGGNNWIHLSSGTDERLHSVYFINDTTGYAVGEGGALVKTTNGGGFPTVVENPITQSTFTIYPNPASNKISITASSNKPQGETLINIYSINGQLIRSDKFQKPERFEMDVSTIAKGIYLLRIQSAEGVETQKLVLQ